MSKSVVYRDKLRPATSLTSERRGQPEAIVLHELFRAIQASGEHDKSRVGLFFGTGSSTRVVNIVADLARLAVNEGACPVLLLDATGSGIWAGPDMLQAFRCGSMPFEIALPTSNRRIRWAAIGRMLGLAGDDVGEFVMTLRRSFPITLIDCGAMTRGTSAIALAQHCDGCAAIVASHQSRALAIGISRVAIEHAGGRLLGIAMIDQNDSLERWVPAGP